MSNTLNDKDLLALALEGKQQAFSLLLERHCEALRSFMRQNFSLGEAEDDLLMITFDKAFHHLEHYNPKYAFTTWLYTIAQNTCIDYARKMKSLGAHQAQNLPGTQEIEYNFTVQDPESEMIASQEAARLLHYIKQLKPIYREPIQLRYLHDFAHEEIAAELGIPLGTVKTRIHRAKEMLIKQLQNDEHTR